MTIRRTIETKNYPKNVHGNRYAVAYLEYKFKDIEELRTFLDGIEDVEATIIDNDNAITIRDHKDFVKGPNKAWIDILRDNPEPAFATAIDESVVICSRGQSKLRNIIRLFANSSLGVRPITGGYLTERGENDTYPSFYIHPLEIYRKAGEFEFPDQPAYGYAVEINEGSSTLYAPPVDLRKYTNETYDGYWPNRTIIELFESGWFEGLHSTESIHKPNNRRSEPPSEKKAIRRGDRKSTTRNNSTEQTEVTFEESQLVIRYQDFCRSNGDIFNNDYGKTENLETDAWRWTSHGEDSRNRTLILIEAKSKVDRFHVRTAIGQIFDYAFYYLRNTDHQPSRLEILLPERPEDSLINLCSSVGIDVTYETQYHSGNFNTVEASRLSVSRTLQMISGEDHDS